jgi:hypothetical protein
VIYLYLDRFQSWLNSKVEEHDETPQVVPIAAE